MKEEEQEYEITHRVFLDVDIDDQRQGIALTSVLLKNMQ